MKCIKCGNEMPDNVLFCTYCGTKLQPAEMKTETVDKVEPTVETEIKAEENATVETETKTEVEANTTVEVETKTETETTIVDETVKTEQVEAPKAEQQPMEQPKTVETPVQNTPMQGGPVQNVPVQSAPVQQTAPAKSKTNVLLLGILIVGILAVIGIIVFLASKIFGGSSASEKALVYLKDDKLYYTSNMDKDKDPILVTKDTVYSEAYASQFELSSDGKYLYYISEGKMELCRAEVGKLKEDTDKNENYIDEIARNVSSFTLIDNDLVMFRQSTGNLGIYDGKTDEKIDSNVNSSRLSEDGENIIYTKGEYEYSLYVYNIKSKESTEIAEDVTSLENWGNSELVFYMKGGTEHLDYYEDEYYYEDQDYYENQELYYVDMSGKGGVIDTGIYNVNGICGDGTIAYYEKRRVETKTLYDLVDDPYAEAETDIKAPVEMDFLTPVTEAEALSASDEEYLAEYPDRRERFFRWLSVDYSMDDYKYYFNSDEDYTLYYYDETSGQWYRFETERYEQEVSAYDAVAERVELREVLKNETISWEYYDLYRWEKGKDAVCIAENVDSDNIRITEELGLVTYSKIEESSSKVSIDDLYYSYYLADTIRENVSTGRETYSYYYIDSEQVLDDFEGRLTYISASEDGKYLVARQTLTDSESWDEDNSLVTYEIKGGKLENPQLLTEEANIGDWIGNTYYYYQDIYEDAGDLYCFENGKSERIIRNINTYSLIKYEDDNLVAYEDYTYGDGYSYTGVGDLVVYNANGEEVGKISDVASRYQYLNEKRIVYIKDDDLYVYTGKDEDRRVARNVDDFITLYHEGEYVY